MNSLASKIDRYDVLQTCRRVFLDELTALLRDSRLVTEPAIKAFISGAGAHFDTVEARRKDGSFEEEVRGLTSSKISLVGEDDLEIDIRLEDLCRRLAESTSVELWKTHLRFMTLLGRPDLPKSQNPIGPESMVAGLHSLFGAAGASSIEEKLMLVDRLEMVLREGLPVIYMRIDTLLQQSGAETAQANIVNTPAISTKPTATPTKAAPSSLLAPDNVLSHPGKQHRPTDQVTMENLLFRIDQLEQGQGNNADFLTATSPKLEALLPGLFGEPVVSTGPRMQAYTARDFGIPGQSAEAQAIEQVGRMYATLFTDRQIPETTKQWLAPVQLTMIRVALKDKQLFSRPDHPLRELINAISDLASTLPANTDSQHPLHARVLAITSELRGEEGSGLHRIRAAAMSLNELLLQRMQAVQTASAAYLPLVKQLDRLDEASRDIALLLDTEEIRALPTVLRTLLQRDWKRLLEAAWFSSGSTGDEWQALASTVERLLWTFRPKQDAAERAQLARELPEVLSAVKQGMDRLQLAPATQTSVLDACFELQTRAMRAVAAPAKQTVSPETPATTASRQGQLEAGERVLHTLDLATPVPGQQAPSLPPPGSWLSLPLDGLAHTVCYCQRSPVSGRCLMFNDQPAIAISIHPVLLEQGIREGSIQLLSNPPLFDRLLAPRASNLLI